MITSGNRLAGPYEGTGALATYSFSFKVFSKNDISVVVADTSGAETTLVLDSDYSVALNADQDASPGGTITLLDGNLTIDYLLSVIGNLAYAQSTQLPNGGAYNAAVVEQMADKLAIQIQQVREIANRAMQLPVTAAGVSATLPAIVPGAVFAWNATGDGIVAVQLTDLDTALVSAAAADVMAQATLALMRAALGASVVGNAVFTAASEAAARAALGVRGEALTTGGTSSAFTLTPAPAISGYAENQEFDVEFHTASAGTPTVNISGLGAKNLKYRDPLGTLVTIGTLIPSGWRSKVTYDGADMIVREMPQSAYNSTSTPAVGTVAGSAGSAGTHSDSGHAHPPMSGSVIQKVTSTDATVLGPLSGSIPADDTIPQSSEGDLVFSFPAFTPKSASSTLVIHVNLWGSTSSSFAYPTWAVFNSGSANAIGAGRGWPDNGSGNAGGITIIAKEASGSTSARTYTVRVGISGGNWYINGNATGTRRFGGVSFIVGTIEEIAA